MEENSKYRQFQEAVLRVVSDTHLTHEQAMMQLSRLAESYTEGFPMPEGFLELQDELDEMSAMGEGFVPYVPRYILPDYDKLMREGCGRPSTPWRSSITMSPPPPTSPSSSASWTACWSPLSRMRRRPRS